MGYAVARESGNSREVTGVEPHPGQEFAMSADSQVAQTVSEAVAVFRQQHARLRELLSTVLGNTGPAREQAWLDVRRRIALHESAEALAVASPGPAAGRSDGGPA